MSQGFVTVSHADGASIFEPGDQALRFYVVQSGKVAIIDRKRNQTLECSTRVNRLVSKRC